MTPIRHELGHNRRPHQPPRDAHRVGEKPTKSLIVLSVVSWPVIAYGIAAGLLTGSYGASFFAAVVGLPLWLYLYASATGLKLAWDDQRIYMRPPSLRPLSWRPPWLSRFPWRSLAYAEISRMHAVTIDNPDAKSFLLPFRMLQITARGADGANDDRNIWLYSLALREHEVAPLLHKLNGECPEMLPAIVRERLAVWDESGRGIFRHG